MSAVYGPIILGGVSGGAAVDGVVYSVQIAQETSVLVVENDSLSDILLSVNPIQPSTISNAAAAAGAVFGQPPLLQGGWDLRIGPRRSATLTIPTQYLIDSPRGPYWTGTIWLQGLLVPNVANAPLAGTFVNLTGANVWITAYGPGEGVPDVSGEDARALDGTQTRNLAIPPSPSMGSIAQVTPSATATYTNIGGPKNLGGTFPSNNSAILAGITPVSAGSTTMYVLLYDLDLEMQNLSATAGTAEAQQVTLQFSLINGSAVTVASTVFYQGYFQHLALQSDSRFTICYANPVAIPLGLYPVVGGPWTLQPQLQVTNVTGGGGTNIKPMLVNMHYDVAGAIPYGATGGVGSLASQPSGSSGVFVY